MTPQVIKGQQEICKGLEIPMAGSARGKVLSRLYRSLASFVFRTALLSASLLTRADPSGAPCSRWLAWD